MSAVNKDRASPEIEGAVAHADITPGGEFGRRRSTDAAPAPSPLRCGRGHCEHVDEAGSPFDELFGNLRRGVPEHCDARSIGQLFGINAECERGIRQGIGWGRSVSGQGVQGPRRGRSLALP